MAQGLLHGGDCGQTVQWIFKCRERARFWWTLVLPNSYSLMHDSLFPFKEVLHANKLLAPSSRFVCKRQRLLFTHTCRLIVANAFSFPFNKTLYMVKQSRYIGRGCWIITLASTYKVIAACSGVLRGLPILPIHSCIPSIPPVCIHREAVEMEPTTLRELTGVSYGTETLSHPSNLDQE